MHFSFYDCECGGNACVHESMRSQNCEALTLPPTSSTESGMASGSSAACSTPTSSKSSMDNPRGSSLSQKAPESSRQYTSVACASLSKITLALETRTRTQRRGSTHTPDTHATHAHADAGLHTHTMPKHTCLSDALDDELFGAGCQVFRQTRKVQVNHGVKGPRIHRAGECRRICPSKHRQGAAHMLTLTLAPDAHMDLQFRR